MGKKNRPLKTNIEIEDDIVEEIEMQEIIGTIIDGDLRIRKEPSVSSDILAILPSGTPLNLGTEIISKNGFYKVETTTIKGWAMSKFIAIR